MIVKKQLFCKDTTAWWHDNMEINFTLLTLRWGIHRSPLDSPHKGPVMRVSNVIYDMALNKLLNEQWSHRWLWMQWASCQIRKIAGAHAPGMPGTFSPSPQVSDPDMHHGTCVTHVPWCMPGSLTSGFLWNRRREKTFPAFPVHAQPAILRIW